VRHAIELANTIQRNGDNNGIGKSMKKTDIGRTINKEGVINHHSYKYPTIYVSETHHLALADRNNNHDYVVLPNCTADSL
jgi:hypothetical protein